MLTYNINKAFNCNHPFSTVAQATGSTVTIKDTMASEEFILIPHISTNAKVYGGRGGDIKKMYPVLAVNIDSKSKIIFRLNIGYYLVYQKQEYQPHKTCSH